MSPRKRRRDLEDDLDDLVALREDPDSQATAEALRRALGDKRNVIVGKAAALTAELGRADLVEDVFAVLERFLEADAENDKGCLAKTALTKALIELEHPASGLFLRGIRHVQMEGSYGGSTDVAIELRANSAIGLVNCGYPGVVREVVPLLVDPGFPVRLAAAQAIGAAGAIDAEAVLRFKVFAGDEEPEVLTECFVGLLRLAPERTIAFARPILTSGRLPLPPDPAERRGLDEASRGGDSLRHAVILALGESREEAAVPLLVERYRRAFDPEERRMLLLALVTSRRDPALDFLLSLVAEAEPRQAKEAVHALAIHRHDTRIRRRVEEAVKRNPASAEVGRYFEREF